MYSYSYIVLLQSQSSHMEHMPISEWLMGYKLADYAPVLEGNGYETTELLVGVSHEELQEMGINKMGHRKKLLSALSNWPQQESFFQEKPVGYCCFDAKNSVHSVHDAGECVCVAQYTAHVAV